ncbi:MAG: methyltransferase domain-containing protein [Phototrophicaceae bacterium]
MAQHFPESYFKRHDSSSDHNFYSFARKVVHIDDGAINALRTFYADNLPKNGTYLDLMTSWRSHLPDSLQPKRVYGLGMNDEEMVDNPQLDEHIVHSLNDNPQLPYDAHQFDAVLCAVSVQYLTQPLAVFSEAHRVLKPNGQFIVSFSNRCFPTKAVAVWLNMTDKQHIALITRYFELSGGWQNIQAESKTSRQHDPMFIVHGRKST